MFNIPLKKSMSLHFGDRDGCWSGAREREMSDVMLLRVFLTLMRGKEWVAVWKGENNFFFSKYKFQMKSQTIFTNHKTIINSKLSSSLYYFTVLKKPPPSTRVTCRLSNPLFLTCALLRNVFWQLSSLTLAWMWLVYTETCHLYSDTRKIIDPWSWNSIFHFRFRAAPYS
jgi:hypothetical protein